MEKQKWYCQNFIYIRLGCECSIFVFFAFLKVFTFHCLNVCVIIPVTERSEDTGLVYTLSAACWSKSYKFSTKGCFFFEEQRAIAEKLILAISGKKKEIVKTNKKLREKVVNKFLPNTLLA